MSVRRDNPANADDGLDGRARLALFHGTSVTAERGVAMPEAEINFDALVRSGCTSLNVSAAGITPLKLKQIGCTDASQMRRLGYDALHLVDTPFCNEINSAFGAANVVAAFVASAQDAVAVAGSDAVNILNLSVQQLLECCAGAPIEAAAVLQQTPGANVLDGVSASTLLDTGLRAPKLRELGVTAFDVSALAGSNKHAITKLGFGI
jgi:hypothetical protein